MECVCYIYMLNTYVKIAALIPSSTPRKQSFPGRGRTIAKHCNTIKSQFTERTSMGIAQVCKTFHEKKRKFHISPENSSNCRRTRLAKEIQPTMPFFCPPAMRLARLINIIKHQAQIFLGVVQLQVLKSILTLVLA